MKLYELDKNFKSQYYFFDPDEYGKIYTFVDFGNVRSWAKEFWPEENKFRFCVEIDIARLSKVCDWVKPKRKFFYYGYFPKRDDLDWNHKLNIKYRNSIYRIEKARESGFQKRSKEIKMIPYYDEDGKYYGRIPKCNFDVEIAMDMLIKIKKYDSVMLFLGDSDFSSLLSYLKSKGKKVIIVYTRGYMSTELKGVADKYIPAETLKSFLKYDKINTPPKKAEE